MKRIEFKLESVLPRGRGVVSLFPNKLRNGDTSFLNNDSFSIMLITPVLNSAVPLLERALLGGRYKESSAG